MAYRAGGITGKYATGADNGQQVYDLIYPELLAGQSVELDFDGVNVFASAFFNFAIGQLLKDISPDALNKLLKITGLSPKGYSILRRINYTVREFEKECSDRISANKKPSNSYWV